MKVALITYIKSVDNVAGLMTEVLSGGELRDKLIQGLLWDMA
jgi:hypothetical protein